MSAKNSPSNEPVPDQAPEGNEPAAKEEDAPVTNEPVEDKKQEESTNEPAAAAVDGDAAAESKEPAEDAAATPEATAVKVDDPENIRVQNQCVEIFSRASEGKPIYDELGGLPKIAEALGVDLEGGLDSDKVDNHRDTWGANKLPEEEPITFFQILLAAWSDHMIILLAIAAIIALVLGMTVNHDGGVATADDRKTGWIEGVAIIISIGLVTTISSVNDYFKELKFRELTESNAKQSVRVKRSGEIKTVDVTEIVVGDVLFINPGLVTPADGFFLTGDSVVIDESAITGENDPKKKTSDAPFILTGTTVNTAEKAWMFVGAVGEGSFGGRLLMSSRVEGPPPPTPLQDRLDDMAAKIGYVGMAAALLLFIILAIWEGVKLGQGHEDANAQNYLTYFIISVAIVVVAVPEGLPLAVAIALAYSQSKMMEDKNQVRRLKACETMGNATNICSDKTGTLTQNAMSVVQLLIGDVHYQVAEPGESDYKQINIENVNQEVIDIMTKTISVCSSSEKTHCFPVGQEDNEEDDAKKKSDLIAVEKKWRWALDRGNKTDNAVLDLVDRVMMPENSPKNVLAGEVELPHQIIRNETGAQECRYFPFTSERKRQSVIIKGDDANFMYVKGGSDIIFELCDTLMTEEGKIVEFEGQAERVQGKIDEFADQANRTIGIAFAKLPAGDLPEDEPSVGLTWLTLLGIQDPLRPGVEDAVAKCQMAGVTVRMCTGDNIKTAVAISKDCGIYKDSENHLAMEGREFREKVYESYRRRHEEGEEAGIAWLNDVLDRCTVVARCQPLDKQLLVLTLMMRGEVVAVTGDGTNDAPALKLAHVGFVMNSGTDIAKKSSDIVLMDDNFVSVMRAVIWGRTVNDNIRKFLQLQLTVNIVSVSLVFVGSLTNDGYSPLNTVQLLWINLIMDTFAALALATESKNDESLKRQPVSKRAPLVSRRMWCTMLVQAVYQLTLCIVLLHTGDKWFTNYYIPHDDPKVNPDDRDYEHTTLVFNTFVWCTVFNEFNARKLYDEKNIFEGFDRSAPFFIILLITAGFQVFAVEGPINVALGAQGQSWQAWLCAIGLGLGSWPLGVLSRFIPVTEPVLDREYDPEGLDDDAQDMVKKLEKDIHEKLGIPVKGADDEDEKKEDEKKDEKKEE